MPNTPIDKSTSNPQFSPLSIVRMVWNRKIFIVFWFILMVSGAALLIHRMPNVYRAESVVLVDSQKIPEKYVTSTVEVSLEDSLMAISKEVLNGHKLEAIIKDFHLYEDQWKTKSSEELVDRLRKELSVTLEHGLASNNRAGAFRISFDARDPKVVVGVVRRVTDLFIKENFVTREERAQGTARFIDTQLGEAKKRLDEQEAAVSQYKLRFAGELPEQEAALAATLGRLQAELQGTDDAINRAHQNKMTLESTLQFNEASLAAASRSVLQSETPVGIVPDNIAPAVSAPDANVVRRSDTLRAQLAALRRRYLDDHPEVRRLKGELDRALTEEAKASKEEAAKPSEKAPKIPVFITPVDGRSTEALAQATAEANRLREQVFSTNTQLAAIAKEIETRTRDRQQLVTSLSEYQARLERLPIREQQMASLMRDYQISKLAYQSLLDKKMSADMATDMERSDNSERFTIADPPRQPTKPIKPKRLAYLAGAILGSFVLSLLAAVALELNRNVFLGEWELSQTVNVLGRIPEMSGAVTAVPYEGIS